MLFVNFFNMDIMKQVVKLFFIIFLFSCNSAYSNTDYKESIKKLGNSTLVALANSDHEKLANLFHYPSNWTDRQIDYDKCHMGRNFKYMSGKFGKLIKAKESNVQPSRYYISIGSGDEEFWGSQKDIITISLESVFEKEPEVYIFIEIALVNGVVKLKQVGYSYSANIKNLSKVSELMMNYVADRKKRGSDGVCEEKVNRQLQSSPASGGAGQ